MIQKTSNNDLYIINYFSSHFLENKFLRLIVLQTELCIFLFKVTVKSSLCLEYIFTEMSYIECFQYATFWCYEIHRNSFISQSQLCFQALSYHDILTKCKAVTSTLQTKKLWCGVVAMGQCSFGEDQCGNQFQCQLMCQFPCASPQIQIVNIQSEPLRNCYKFNHPPQGRFCSMEMWESLQLCNDCWIVSADHDQRRIRISPLLCVALQSRYEIALGRKT